MRLMTCFVVVMVGAAGAVNAQPKPFSIPQDPVAAYFDVIVIPVMSGKVPSESDLLKFYGTFLSIHSQARVAEDQFVAYWQDVGQRAIGAQFWAAFLLGANYTLTYDIGEPVYNESRDQARFKVTVTITTHRGFTSSSENRIMFAHVINESSIWKIVLSDEIVAEMQKLPTKITARKYPVQAEGIAGGLRLIVKAVVLDKELTSLEMAVRNTSSVQANLFNAISAATLADQIGMVYAARTLRSTIPTSIAPGQSAEGVLAFFAVPLNARWLKLTLPEIRMGEDVVVLILEMRF